MPLTFVPGGRYENPAGAFTVLEVANGTLRVLTDAGHIGRYTVANQQIHARPTRKPSPFSQKVVDPVVDDVTTLFRRVFAKHGWEIYPQPHLNGLRPELVALNPRVGMALYHVSDIDAASLSKADVAEELVRTRFSTSRRCSGCIALVLG